MTKAELQLRVIAKIEAVMFQLIADTDDMDEAELRKTDSDLLEMLHNEKTGLGLGNN